MKYWRTILIVFGLLLFAILIAHHLRRPLGGASVMAQDVEFSFKNWFSGEYQKKKEKYLNESFCFRNPCIRINNQIYFSLFDKINAEDCILGKGNHIYEEQYIHSYFGDDFIGNDSISNNLKKFRFLQDTLSKLNKSLILIIAPDKAHFFPEYFPEKFSHKKIKTTNYDCYVKTSKELKINYVDFNDYFVQNKKNFKFPIFSIGGGHWSYYGAMKATDSIIHYIEALRKIDMPEIKMGDIELSAAQYDDYDMGNAANLLFPLGVEKLAYPKYQFESNAGKDFPAIFVISDSFYKTIYRFLKEKYLKDQSWYYYNKEEVFPDRFAYVKFDEKPLRDKINKQDVIVIMTNDVNLKTLGWGFIDQAYSIFSKK
jgi:hypothetical protein